jgi:phage-related baseplate assembly protein
MKLSKMYPRKYATGEDLHGNAVTVTVKNITVEKMSPRPGQPPQDNFVIYFQETIKGVILSRTLAEQIASALQSDDTDDWTGKKITLYPEPLTVAGTPRIAIRARKAAQV